MSALLRSTRLSDVCRFQSGGTPSKSIDRYFTGDIPWITGADLVGPIALQARSFITEEAIASSATNQVPAGTVLLVTRTSVGKVSIAGMSLCFSQDITSLTPDAKKLSAEYLVHFLRTKETHFSKLARGATIQGITRQVVADLEIPLSPLEEQRRIAAILDQAETLRTQRRAALTQLDSLTQSLFLEMFGDPVLNPKGWSVAKFGGVGTLDRGISKHRPRNAPELLGGGYPLVQTGEVSNCDGYIRDYTHTYSDIGLRQSKMWPAGTLCITIAANIAKTGILTFDACFPDSVVGFRADDPATVEYVRVWLSFLQKALEDSAPESAQKNINLAILRALNIPMPPLALQQTFATRIQAIEALKAAHRAALAELDALFASLQQRAFSGELTRPLVSAVPAIHVKVKDFGELSKLDTDKGLEALIYVARRMPEHHFYKSLKALYFADKHQLEHQGRLIYGETHCALPMGPVPQAAYDAAKVLSGELLVSAYDDGALRASLRRTDKELIPLRDADPAKLSAEERASLDWAISYVAPMSFEQVKTTSHDSAYERTPRNQPIQLEHLIEMLPETAKKRFFAKS